MHRSLDGRRIVKVRLKSERPWPDEALVDAGLTTAPVEDAPQNGVDTRVRRIAEHQ